ncbi:MAG: endonuclease/exonuclease/phosphatase family protein [Motiliproteus sp.]
MQLQKNMNNYMSSSCIGISRWLYLIILSIATAVALLPYWPEARLFSLGGYALLFAPRWWILALPVILLLTYRRLNRWQQFSILPITLICINFTDVQWIPHFSESTSERLEVRIMSVNIGNNTNQQKLLKAIKDNQPYVVFLQEARKPAMDRLFNDDWITDCAGSLCIASRFSLERIGDLNRRSLGGWGSYAAKYEADIFGQTVQLLNVHLDTPRTVLENLIHLNIDFSDAEHSVQNRNIQASVVSNWLTKNKPFIIAGDFNMPVNENIYRHYLGHLGNALDYSSLGLRYTKYTKWHGIRIDHILFNDSFVVKEAKVLGDFGGDHRPIVTVLGQTL